MFDVQTKVIIRRKFEDFHDFKGVQDSLASTDACICYGDKFNLNNQYIKFNRFDWLYDDGFTYIGRIDAKDLIKTDEVLTMDINTQEFQWMGYDTLSFSESKKMIKFFFGSDNFDYSQTLKVTLDHELVIRHDEDISYSSIRAFDLCRLLDSNKKCYIKLRNGFEVKLDRYEIFNIERDVWNLSTVDNCSLCVSTEGNVIITDFLI